MKRKHGKLPAFLKRYFWDVPFAELHPRRSRTFVLERILEYGDQRAVRWMDEQFDQRAIRETVARSQRLSVRSANFWASVYNLRRPEVRCLSKRFQQKRRQHWIA